MWPPPHIVGRDAKPPPPSPSRGPNGSPRGPSHGEVCARTPTPAHPLADPPLRTPHPIPSARAHLRCWGDARRPESQTPRGPLDPPPRAAVEAGADDLVSACPKALGGRPPPPPGRLLLDRGVRHNSRWRPVEVSWRSLRPGTPLPLGGGAAPPTRARAARRSCGGPAPTPHACENPPLPPPPRPTRAVVHPRYRRRSVTIAAAGACWDPQRESSPHRIHAGCVPLSCAPPFAEDIKSDRFPYIPGVVRVLSPPPTPSPPCSS